MSKRMLAILGSPHTEGITAKMLDCAVNAANAAGWKVDTIHLYEKQIAFCQGCRRCLATQACVIMDDVQTITELLKKCNMVVLAAPVYWANVPAVVKNLFDRLLGTAMEETKTFPKPRLSGKKYMFLTACNTPFPFSWMFGQSRGAIRAVKEFFQTAGMKGNGIVVCSNTGKRKGLPEFAKKKIQGRFS